LKNNKIHSEDQTKTNSSTTTEANCSSFEEHSAFSKSTYTTKQNLYHSDFIPIARADPPTPLLSKQFGFGLLMMMRFFKPMLK